MATPNFQTQKHFSLWVKDFSIYDDNGEFLDNDEFALMETLDKIKTLNSTLSFFRVTLTDGRYTGTQFYVERKSSDTELPTDYTAQEWGENRKGYCGDYYYPDKYSLAIRREQAERRKINRWLAAEGKKLGFEQLICVAIFSNGEAVYRRAEAC